MYLHGFEAISQSSSIVYDERDKIEFDADSRNVEIEVEKASRSRLCQLCAYNLLLDPRGNGRALFCVIVAKREGVSAFARD